MTKCPSRLLIALVAALMLLHAPTPSCAVTEDFDPDGSALASFTAVPGPSFSVLTGAAGAGSGNPVSGGVNYDGTAGFELAFTPSPILDFASAGAAVRISVDVKFANSSAQTANLATIAVGGGGLAYLIAQSTGSGTIATSVNSTTDGSIGSPVASGSTAFTTNWLRLDGTFEYDGADMVVNATVSDLGADGTTPPTALVNMSGTFDNALMEGSPQVFGGLGATTAGGGAQDATQFDNLTFEQPSAVPAASTWGLMFLASLLASAMLLNRRAAVRRG